MNLVSIGLSRKIASEFATNHAIISMGTIYFSLDYSGFASFTARNHCVDFCYICISTCLAQIEFSFTWGINTFSFKKTVHSC